MDLEVKMWISVLVDGRFGFGKGRGGLLAVGAA